MATLQQFKDIKSSLSSDQQSSFYEQFVNDQDGAINKMISILRSQKAINTRPSGKLILAIKLVIVLFLLNINRYFQ